MITNIAKWGNGHAVRLSKEIMNQAKLIPSDKVTVTVNGEEIIYMKLLSKPDTVDQKYWKVNFLGINKSVDLDFSEGFGLINGKLLKNFEYNEVAAIYEDKNITFTYTRVGSDFGPRKELVIKIGKDVIYDDSKDFNNSASIAQDLINGFNLTKTATITTLNRHLLRFTF